jgi:hypothetical protein
MWLNRQDGASHFEALCALHRVEARIIKGCRELAYPTLRVIYTRPIEQEWDYCTAMHELGHVVFAHAPEQNRAWKEILAWKWARANAFVWTPAMEAHKNWCLNTRGITSEKILLDYLPRQSIL